MQEIGMPSSVVVRIFVDAPPEQAGPVLAQAERSLATVDGVVVAREVEPYWKEPGWQEVSFRLVVDDADVPRAFAAVKDALGSGWSDAGDDETPSAVWSAGPAARFFDARVRFANLEVASEG